MTRTPLARHATAIAVVLLTFFAQGPIQRLVGPTGPPLIFFVPAVTISAWQEGEGRGSWPPHSSHSSGTQSGAYLRMRVGIFS